MKARDLRSMGIHSDQAMAIAFELIKEGREQDMALSDIRQMLAAVATDPEAGICHPMRPLLPQLTALAQAQIDFREAQDSFVPREEPAPFRQWGEDLDEALGAPAAERLRAAGFGARRPDARRPPRLRAAHRRRAGYPRRGDSLRRRRRHRLPYEDDRPRPAASTLDDDPDRLRKAIQTETRFGIGAKFRTVARTTCSTRTGRSRRWYVALKDKAWAQLGTSGSGNHFVEFGVLTLERRRPGLPAEGWALETTWPS